MKKLVSRAVPQGVFVITAKAGDRINGMTAAWVSQVSFNPLLVGVAIAPARYTHGLIEEGGLFCVNALPKGAVELAKAFGFKSGRKVDKFQGVEHFPAANGTPVLKAAYAYLECKMASRCETGDHTFFLGEVVDGRELDPQAEPLIFRWDDFFGGN